MVYLHNNKEQFAEAISLTVYKSGLSEEVVEKDYYVTMILRYLLACLPLYLIHLYPPYSMRPSLFSTLELHLLHYGSSYIYELNY